ncbi:phosphorylase [Jiella sp. M17.18]|uniref:phosphorylase family protein n=1 Tax=Jiella sp. M17.18 TaxID=3234247 RepID=UPI0034E0550E
MRHPGAGRRILVVSGLAAEARIAAGDGILTCAAPPAALAARLQAIDPADLHGVVSFGLCGGLVPAMRAGDLVLASAVLDRGVTYPCDQAAADRLGVRWAGSAMGGAPLHRGAMATAGEPVLTVANKRRLSEALGAVAVDTESHLAARFAAEHGLPFVVLRAVSDTADRPLPPLAIRAISPDGRLDLRAIAEELTRRPRQLALLPGLARDTARAMATLRRVRGLLGPGLGLLV